MRVLKLSTACISPYYSFIFQQVYVSLTYMVIVLLPYHVSMQFAPSSGECSRLYYLKLSLRLVHKYNKIFV
jgi:hypothetical protein